MTIRILSSEGRCGIYEYSQMLIAGLQEQGEVARYVGVPNWDDRALLRAAHEIGQNETVVIEYEPGIFRLVTLVLVMALLRWRRSARVVLSVHEIAPDKFPQSHHIRGRLHQPVRFDGPAELARIAGVGAEVGLRYLFLRASLYLLGALPQVVLVHSARGREALSIALNPNHPKVHEIPLLIETSEGDRTALRHALDLPEERFLFIIPGFLFRRKQIVEVIEQLPADATLLIVGTASEYDPGYTDEIEAAIAARPGQDIRLIQEYDAMMPHLHAADAAILFYRDGFQSAIAAQALGAGKPCIFSDLPAFRPYKEAGLLVDTPSALAEAMRQIQEPEMLEALRQGALRLRERYSPARTAGSYLDAISSRRPMPAAPPERIEG